MKAIGILGLALIAAATAQAETPAQKSARLAQNFDTLMRHYPARALAAGEQGLVAFNVRLDKDGQPTNCEVTHSSGHRLLDDETCQLVLIHAVFEPVKDSEGNKTNTIAEGVVNWKIPGAAAPAILLPPVAVTAANAPEKMICKRTLRIGTLAGYERTCMTQTQWRSQTDAMKQPYDDIQGKKGMATCISMGGGPCTGG